MNGTTALDGLVPLKDFATSYPAIFPSETSAVWYVRRHREALRKGHALYQIARRTYVDPVAFATVVRDIGRKTA